MLKKYHNLDYVLSKLNDNNIKYGLIAGGFLFIHSSSRRINDIDLIVDDDDFNKLDNLFQDKILINNKKGNYLYPFKDYSIELMSNMKFNIFSHLYQFSLTKLAWSKTSKLISANSTLIICNPVDTILLKAILQRKEKNDLEDIEEIIKISNINKDYLNDRLNEINYDKRVLYVLKMFDLV